MTHDEMRQMWREGDTLAVIVARARARNGIGITEVRRIVFGDGG